ncbi:MAG TPA: hypothetical protein VMS04_13325, partial [Vicinamibacterales bacterium]|nr:hypothetical protein [Vicinamibacterales bacterium]
MAAFVRNATTESRAGIAGSFDSAARLAVRQTPDTEEVSRPSARLDDPQHAVHARRGLHLPAP